ncbi:putative two-component histidine kinase [Gordonia soli NBRC 108243]|uniref:histidine kinase n=1 Tax=Gordonia soli NBRC 108243 TaxID=1223545 RepID=M0QGS6_9ACTN|nr:putative two-component histidine kinase [Gordonia soli NBRC 108243]
MLLDRLQAAGGDYPPLYPVVMLAASAAVTVVATLQRHPFSASWWVVAAIVTALGSLALDLTIPASVPPCVLGIVSTVCFLMDPVATDAAPVQLALVTAIAAAMQTLRVGVLIAVLCAVVIGGFWWGDHLRAAPVYLLAVACGWLVGYMVLIQKRLAQNQVRTLQERAERAASDERRRIAREIHDVVAHSLSITMLNVTGARHVLEHGRDTADAIDALGDAERQGRQAMTEIRHIVHVLGSDQSSDAPTPGAGDIAELVRDHRKAGMTVSLRTVGDLAEVSTPVGAALYRITQESLTNVVRHGGVLRASIQLTTVGDQVEVSVRNPVRSSPRSDSGNGTGVEGMRQRAALLGGSFEAARDGATWAVRARLPIRVPAEQGST